MPLLGALMAGIILGSWIPDQGLRVFPVAIAGTAGIIYGIVRHSSVRTAPIILFIITGYFSIQPWVTSKLPSHHVSRFATSTTWNITGFLNSSSWIDNDRQKFDLTVETLTNQSTSLQVTGKIRVNIEGHHLELNMGDRISFTGKIYPLRNFKNPGGFDYKQYMAFNGIYGSAFVKSKEIDIKKASQDSFFQGIERFRKIISLQIDRAYSKDDDVRGVMKALIIGDRSSISDQMTENFRNAGISHLLAISGLHVGIVATTSFFIFKWLLSWSQFFLWRAWTRKGAAILSIMPVLGYGLIAGMSPSTQRAVIMISVFLLTFLIHRDHEPFNTLAVAAMTILIIHPPSLFSISFQLSFASVFSILYLQPRLWESPEEDKIPFTKHVKNIILAPLWLSLSATLGTLLIVMHYFNQISFISPVANFILVPLVGFGVVPVGLFSAGLSLIAPELSLWGFKTSAIILSPCLDLAGFLGELPFSAIKTITPSFLEMICCYTIILIIVTVKKRREKQFSRLSGNKTELTPRTKKILLGFFIAATATLGTDIAYWTYQRFFKSDFRVTVIDVGQGTASLIEFPKGHVMLVDAGGFPNNAVFDIGKMVVAPLLWRKKIGSVETLVLSHPNSDHLNGMIYIAENFRVKEAWTNNEAEESLSYQKLMEVIKGKNIRYIDFRTFPRQHVINGVTLDILNPPGDFMEKYGSQPWRTTNNNSLTIRASFGNVSILFPGDIESGAEKEMVAIYNEKLETRIMIAPHHGSKSSNSFSFIKKVKPEFVLFTTGLNNRFNFPHPSIIKQYEEIGSKTFNTAYNGAIMICTDGRWLEVKPYVDN